jgi:hypothetical protein
MHHEKGHKCKACGAEFEAEDELDMHNKEVHPEMHEHHKEHEHEHAR